MSQSPRDILDEINRRLGDGTIDGLAVLVRELYEAQRQRMDRMREKLRVAHAALETVEANLANYDRPIDSGMLRIPEVLYDCLDGRHSGNGSDGSEKSPSVRYALAKIRGEEWKGNP